jgi:hypothetical protein
MPSLATIAPNIERSDVDSASNITFLKKSSPMMHPKLHTSIGKLYWSAAAGKASGA